MTQSIKKNIPASHSEFSIKTPRLILRDPRDEDAIAISEYNSKEAFYKFLPFDPPTQQSTANYIKHIVLKSQEIPRTNYNLIITESNNETAIGGIYLNIESDELRCGVVGFGLNPAHWGHGYMTEALSSLIKFGFDSLNLKRIYAVCDPKNKASAHVLEKAGMQYEGLHRCEELVRGEFCDNCYYSVISND